ncbi:MAG: glycosyltransferase, partial [Alphaproteobacteria bacterium]|nr:glycosyltransferase [Alphaproteobacteria bacterium]
MKNPEISIIIPIYNVQNYLEKCLDSVKNQTFKNWEAICVNDGSTDNSLEILQQYAENDERFVVINQENGGVSSARNTGLNSATGKYIMFLDGDDFIHPQCMEIAHKTIKDTDTNVCDFGFMRVEENWEEKHQYYDEIMDIKIMDTPHKVFALEHNKSVFTLWTKIYKAELAKKIKFNLIPIGEDILYTYDFFSNVEHYALIQNKLIYYRQRSGS